MGPALRFSSAFAFFRSPLLPETIRLFGFAVAGPIVCLDIKGIQPADMVRAPADRTMNSRIRFVIGAHRDTNATERIMPTPVLPTCFPVDGPLQNTTHIGDIMGL